jgi:hypothetical protein
VRGGAGWRARTRVARVARAWTSELACTDEGGAGCEGVARMWIGYADVDRLITYPDVNNLSGCR